MPVLPQTISLQTINGPSTDFIGLGGLNLPVTPNLKIPEVSSLTGSPTSFGLGGLGSAGDSFSAGSFTPPNLEETGAKFLQENLPSHIQGLAGFGAREVTIRDNDLYNIENPSLAQFWIVVPDEDLFKEGSNALETWSTKVAAGVLTGRPNTYQRFKFQRFTQGIGNFEFTIFDKNFNKIRKMLEKSRGSIIFKYGYSSKPIPGESNVISPWIFGRVFNFNIQYSLEGATLNLSGMALGHQIATKITMECDIKKATNIGKLVTELANKAKLIPVVEPTKNIETRNTEMETRELKPLDVPNLGGATTLEYIVRQLIPLAVNEKNESGYVFFVENRGGKNYLHFHTPWYAGEGTKEKDLTYKIPAFTLYKTPLTPVIDYQPNWNRSLIDLAGAAGTASLTYDVTSQTYVDLYTSIDKELDTKGKKEVNAIDQRPWAIEPMATQAQARNAATAKRAVTISANLKVVGTPKFSICDKIFVIVYVPRQFLSTPVDNFTNVEMSDLFVVLGITDTIQNGQFVTDLSLGTAGVQAKIEHAPQTDAPVTK